MVIKELKKANKKIGLVSNSPSYIVEMLTQKFNFSAIFDEIFSIDYDNNPTFAKPSPEGINYVLSRFKFGHHIIKLQKILLMVKERLGMAMAGW